MRVQVWGDNRERLPEGDGDGYTAELMAILRDGDVRAFRSLLVRTNRTLPTDMMLDTFKLETMMRQLTLAMPELADSHAAAREWMSRNAMSSAAGHVRLPGGRLVRKPESETPRGKGRSLPLIQRPPHDN